MQYKLYYVLGLKDVRYRFMYFFSNFLPKRHLWKSSKIKIKKNKNVKLSLKSIVTQKKNRIRGEFFGCNLFNNEYEVYWRGLCSAVDVFWMMMMMNLFKLRQKPVTYRWTDEWTVERQQ